MSQQSEARALPAEQARSVLPAYRQAGVCMHITALPGPYGIGEIGQHAFEFIDSLNHMQLGVWQFLPTGPTAYGDSPYQPLSSFAGNEMLIDIGDLVVRGFLTDDEVAELTTLSERAVDYGSLIPLKSQLLNLAAKRFDLKAKASLKAEFDDFVERHDKAWLHDYALFRILKSAHGLRAWPEWKPEYVYRDEKAIRELESIAAEQIESIKVIQCLFHHQWQRLRAYARDRGVMLFGDMPIYIALDSADAWARRELLKIDDAGQPEAVAGVPPDYFSEEGQLWGNPLYAWDVHAATGYRWWIDRLQAAANLADIVRIDHFRGFEAYWSVPADSQTAKNGEWIPGAGDEIFDAMYAELGSLPIVAEDLGVITPEVDALRDKHNIPGMHVLQFDVTEPDFDLVEVADNSVCYTGTHDNDTTIGWFNGSPGDVRTPKDIAADQASALAVTGGTSETIHLDMIRAAFSTPARLAIAPMQDYLGLGSEARFNTPGTSSNNWRWRVLDTQLTDKLCDNIASMVEASGRGLLG